ncbi:MAG: Uma2 family endonuclease [Fimbriimonadales bacterium]|nr:Uma2 family endonuclease [Fimbriimonadales bacterium]
MPASQTTAKPKRARRKRNFADYCPCLPDIEELQAMIAQLESLDLPEEDGEPLESDYHVMQIPLLDEIVRMLLGDTGDYFCSGNMFIYFSLEQAHEVIEYVNERSKKPPVYKGPDFFLVKGVDGRKPRGKWVVWEEGGRYPDLIVEIVSPRTKQKDLTDNMQIYAKVFRTPEYVWYDQATGELKGYRLVEGEYQEIPPDERGWIRSHVLDAYWGVWEGVWHGRYYRWLRLYDLQGQLVPTAEERERQRAEQERQRAEQAEAELERLRAKLREMGIEP